MEDSTGWRRFTQSIPAIELLRLLGIWWVKFFSSVIAVLWLLFLYVVTIWMVVGTLSAIQLRDEVVASGEKGGFIRVERAIQEAEIKRQRSLEEVDLNDPYYPLAARADELIRQFRDFYNEYVSGDPSDIVSTDIYTIDDLVKTNQYRSVRLDCPDLPKICFLIPKIEEKRAELINYYTSEEYSNYIDYKSKKEAEIEELYRNNPLLGHANTLEFFRDWGYSEPEEETYYINSEESTRSGKLYIDFLFTPRAVLVLLLTMAMGVLGSVVTMTWRLLGPDHLGIRSLFMLPLVGGMSAFIMLVFAKAGQVTLTTGTDPGSLNPFAISFLAIISGLLSERAYEKMSELGNQFFKARDIDRYAIGIEKILKEEKLDLKDLATALDIKKTALTGIVQGNLAANAHQQALIAAALRMRPESLFTDLKRVDPPDEAPPTNENGDRRWVAKGLSEAILESGKSENEIREKLGLSTEAFKNIVDGKSKLDFQQKEKIAVLLDKNANEIFQEVED